MIIKAQKKIRIGTIYIWQSNFIFAAKGVFFAFCACSLRQEEQMLRKTPADKMITSSLIKIM
jgi:hypothetical protein